MAAKLIYLAQPMGARRWSDVLSEARSAVSIVEMHGMKAWSPSLKEVTASGPGTDIIATTHGILKTYWREDLSALKRCDALLSLRGDLASEGVGLEIGIAKYHYKVPVVIVSPKKAGRVTHIEADAVLPTVADACKWLKKKLK